MDKPIGISGLGSYISQIDDVTRPDKTYLYRGQENENWQVNSSAYRRLRSVTSHLKEQSDRPFNFLPLLQGYLLQIVNEVRLKYPSTYKRLHPLECMAHLQHNKVATGLIDFTFSPLVALWFACDNNNVNGKVIVIEKDSKKIEEIKTVETLERDLEEFFEANQRQLYLWSPTLDNQSVDTQRMIMQQSVFLVGLHEMDGEMITQEIAIPAEHKGRLRTELAKMGISEETLFSDLLGFFERNSHKHSYDLGLVESHQGD